MSWTHEAIRIVDADPAWTALAATLAAQVAPHVDGPVEHVGSTAVPGLAAKPIVDLMAGVTTLDDREIPGWHYVPPGLDLRPYRRFHVLVRDDHRAAHLHLLRTDAPRWAEAARVPGRAAGGRRPAGRVRGPQAAAGRDRLRPGGVHRGEGRVREERDRMKVAVLGLGVMGAALAGRAQAQGHEVTGWNRTPREYDVPTAASPTDAVDGAEAVLVVVSDGAAIEELCTADLLRSLTPQAVLAVVSTVAPVTVQTIGYDHVVDSPVIGSPKTVEGGSARYFVGGADADLEALTPLLADLGNSTLRCGPLGAGESMKIASNLQLVVGVAALAEAVALGRANGLSDAVITAGFEDAPIVSLTSRMRLSNLLDPAHPGWFGPALASKDLRLCLELARPAGLDLAVTSGALALLDRLVGEWPDFAAIIEAL